MTLRRVIAILGCSVVGACTSKSSQTPEPVVLRDGIYRFSETQRPLTTPIEGTMTILRDTIMVDAQPGPCRYEDRLSWGKNAIVYRCAEMILTFDRADPLRNSKFDTKVSVDEKKSVCTQYGTNSSGQRVCLQSETQIVSRDVSVSGILHPKRVSKEAPTLTSNEHPLMTDDLESISRRQWLRLAAVAAAGAPFGAAIGQGRCMRRFGTPGCDTTAIAPVFDKTGWKTTALDSLTMVVADYRQEAAFYNALMGWTLRSDDGGSAVMDMGDRGPIVLKQGPGTRAVVESFGFVIEPWNAKTVETELRRRGLSPIAENDGSGYESFHITDPDGFPLTLSNGKRKRPSGSGATLAALPFEPTGWKTVWLDHLSFSVTNYKLSTSFYTNLLGWTTTYDEGSQNECLIGDVGDIIIRGGNPLDPQFRRGGGRGGGRGDDSAASGAASTRRARIDHISFGISPWDTDKVKAELERRGLRARVDTSTGDEIHVAAFKSYHTTTPNGYDLQISAVSHDTRLTLPTAVRPKPPGH